MKPAQLAGLGLAAYLAWKWWKGAPASTTSTTTTKSGAPSMAPGAPVTVTMPPGVASGTLTRAGGLYTDSGWSEIAKKLQGTFPTVPNSASPWADTISYVTKQGGK